KERIDQVVASLLKEGWEEPRHIIKLVGNNWQRASANDSARYDFIALLWMWYYLRNFDYPIERDNL
ncbi:MAG: hypothetical protein ACQKBV_05230, partial [Puniceicoccales bacterium]